MKFWELWLVSIEPLLGGEECSDQAHINNHSFHWYFKITIKIARASSLEIILANFYKDI